VEEAPREGRLYLLPFSCKRRHFCPSCHQKRVVEFGEQLCEKVLKCVPHRQWVFSIPKRLRIYFMFDRKLLSKLSQCVWKVLSVYLKHVALDEDAVAGAVIAIQSFSDFLGFNPHAHVIVSDGWFYGEGAFANLGSHQENLLKINIIQCTVGLILRQ
jgi:hypothetical protein